MKRLNVATGAVLQKGLIKYYELFYHFLILSTDKYENNHFFIIR